jgi:hypothetical protein
MHGADMLQEVLHLFPKNINFCSYLDILFLHSEASDNGNIPFIPPVMCCSRNQITRRLRKDPCEFCPSHVHSLCKCSTFIYHACTLIHIMPLSLMKICLRLGFSTSSSLITTLFAVTRFFIVAHIVPAALTCV